MNRVAVVVAGVGVFVGVAAGVTQAAVDTTSPVANVVAGNPPDCPDGTLCGGPDRGAFLTVNAVTDGDRH